MNKTTNKYLTYEKSHICIEQKVHGFIAVNGNAIELPDTPVRSTNANGIVGYDLYETTVTLPSGTTQIPVVTASASNRAVKVDIAQSESTSGKALVKCDYNGIVKTYSILFATE